MDKSERELEGLATKVHGALGALHGLAVVYNLKRRNWRDAAIHAGFLVYDAAASYQHHKYKKEQEQ